MERQELIMSTNNTTSPYTSLQSKKVGIPQFISLKKWMGTAVIAFATCVNSNSVISSTTSASYEHIQILVNDNPLQFKIEQKNEELHEKTAIETDITKTTISHADRLDEIKSRLGLSITQLAELFGVTRKSIYDWYDGSVKPNTSNINKIEAVIESLDSLAVRNGAVDLQRLKVVWHIPINGQSFCSILNDDKLEIEKLVTKLHELSPRMEKKASTLKKTTIQLGDAHLAEFSRETDFG